jgi:hypothetical protein
MISGRAGLINGAQYIVAAGLLSGTALSGNFTVRDNTHAGKAHPESPLTPQ